MRVEEPADADAATPVEAQPDTPAPDTLDALRQRVAALEAENAALRAQLAALQAG